MRKFKIKNSLKKFSPSSALSARYFSGSQNTFRSVIQEFPTKMYHIHDIFQIFQLGCPRTPYWLMYLSILEYSTSWIFSPKIVIQSIALGAKNGTWPVPKQWCPHSYDSCLNAAAGLTIRVGPISMRQTNNQTKAQIFWKWDKFCGWCKNYLIVECLSYAFYVRAYWNEKNHSFLGKILSKARSHFLDVTKQFCS